MAGFFGFMNYQKEGPGIQKDGPKKKTFIVTVNGQESEFAMELKTRYGEDLKKEQFECPLCGGRLVKRTGQYGEFF